MSKGNKAHTATARRIARRFNLVFNENEGEPDFETNELHIEVANTATLADAISRLKKSAKLAYVAAVNRDALDEAIRLTKNLEIGVIDPQGEVAKSPEPDSE